MTKRTLNKKRLSKAEVNQLIASESTLHEEYTKEFEETYVTGYIKRDRVYALPDDRFLFVFDENGITLGGKGDIYPGEYFRRFVRWKQRVREDYANNRASSVDHWRYYSKNKSTILEHRSELVSQLSLTLKIDCEKLDNTYASLDTVSEACEKFGLDNTINELYDNLVIYVGEVIKERVNGHWEMNESNAGGDYPFIAINLPNVQYMAINVVWESLSGLDDIDLRKQAAAEVRLRGPEVKVQEFFNRKEGRL